jgi:hypothetical protein
VKRGGSRDRLERRCTERVFPSLRPAFTAAVRAPPLVPIAIRGAAGLTAAVLLIPVEVFLWRAWKARGGGPRGR